MAPVLLAAPGPFLRPHVATQRSINGRADGARARTSGLIPRRRGRLLAAIFSIMKDARGRAVVIFVLIVRVTPDPLTGSHTSTYILDSH